MQRSPINRQALIALLIAAVVGGPASKEAWPQSPSVNSISLSRSDVHCIVDNIDQFLGVDADPITIYLDICFGDKDLEDALSGATRLTLPDAPSTPGAKPRSFSALPRSVVLSKVALRCLRSRAKESHFYDKDPIIFDQSECTHE